MDTRICSVSSYNVKHCVCWRSNVAAIVCNRSRGRRHRARRRGSHRAVDVDRGRACQVRDRAACRRAQRTIEQHRSARAASINRQSRSDARAETRDARADGQARAAR